MDNLHEQTAVFRLTQNSCGILCEIILCENEPSTFQNELFKREVHINRLVCVYVLRPINEGRQKYWHNRMKQISRMRFITDSEGLAYREGFIGKLSFLGCDEVSDNWTCIQHVHQDKPAKEHISKCSNMIVLSFLNMDLSVTIKHWLGRKVRLSSERVDSAGLAGRAWFI